MESRTQLIGMCFSCLLLLILLALVESNVVITESQEESLLDQFKIASLKSPCTGIYSYYTGQGFSKDIMNLKELYDIYYSTEGGANPISEDMQLYPPSSLVYANKGIDCEDFAHWTYCMAQTYPNVRCEPYLNDKATHIGQICFEYQNGTIYRLEV